MAGRRDHLAYERYLNAVRPVATDGRYYSPSLTVLARRRARSRVVRWIIWWLYIVAMSSILAGVVVLSVSA